MSYIYRGTKITEDGLKGIFEAYLNDEYTSVEVLDYHYPAGTALRKLDEDSFNTQFRAWVFQAWVDVLLEEQPLDTY